MVRSQIYVDGIALDMPAQDVQLSMQSNLLGKAGELTASFSYTISLPRTLNNDKLLGQAYDVAVTSGKTYTFVDCTYELEGVQLFSGRIAVTDVNADSYSCNLVWGFDELAKMKDEGLKLWELDTSNSHYNDWVYLPSRPTIADKMHFWGRDAFGFAEYDSGIPQGQADMTNNPRLYPCVSARYILARIFEKYGITLDLPQYADEAIDKMVIALTTSYSYREPNLPHTMWELNLIDDPDTHVWSYDLRPYDSGQGVINKMPAGVEGKMIWTSLVECTVTDMHIRISCGEPFYIALPKFNGGQPLRSVNRDVHGRWFIDYSVAEIDVEFGTQLDWEIGVENDTPTHNWMRSLELEDYQFTCTPKSNNMRDAMGYPIMANLPDMTAIEYIEELCAILGVVPIGMDGKSLRCINWSALMQAPTTMDVLAMRTLSLRVDGFAQHNKLAWATDDEKKQGETSELLVEDTSIEVEDEYYTSKFAEMSGIHTIPLYTSSGYGDNFKVERNDITERIAMLDNVFDVAYLTKNGVRWSELIANYETMQKALRKPKVIDATAHIKPSELRNIDYSKAVYVEQYGAYFAVLEVNTGEGDVYDVKMIKL